MTVLPPAPKLPLEEAEVPPPSEMMRVRREIKSADQWLDGLRRFQFPQCFACSIDHFGIRIVVLFAIQRLNKIGDRKGGRKFFTSSNARVPTSTG